MSLNTTALNRELHRFDLRGQVWLFAYGSLIFKPDFDFIERRNARVTGWARRFWQGSHDHRGTAAAPGRVVTLMAQSGAVCEGVAYLITPQVFNQLDYREKNGYLRTAISISFDDHTVTQGLVYIADPHNAAFLGPAPTQEIAQQIATAVGPSGSNRDYLVALAKALRGLDCTDPHVFEIEQMLPAGSPSSTFSLIACITK